jgi:hypothetical protein
VAGVAAPGVDEEVEVVAGVAGAAGAVGVVAGVAEVGSEEFGVADVFVVLYNWNIKE